MSDGKGSKKRENRKHAPYVVRVHEGEKGEEGSTLIIGGKRKEEIKNHGLKGPRCTGTCPSNFKKV